MYISPRGTIKLLRDVPLEPNYEHTLYWYNATAQEAYFASKVKPNCTYTQQSYQRIKRNTINISAPPETLYDCNYLMYNNNRIANKWFYAFITSVDYVNEGVTQVTFEIDVMQTWFFDYRLGECFVEREHSASDAIGDNLVEENLPIGDYIYEDAALTRIDHEYDTNGNPISSITRVRTGSLFKQDIKQIVGEPYANDFSIVIAAPFMLTFVNDTNILVTDAPAGFYNGAFSGLYYNAIPLTNTLRVQTLLSYLSESGLSEKRKKEIVAIFIAPTALITERNIAPIMFSPVCEISTQKYYDWETYTPKNNKLYTYPYNVLYITTSDGISTKLKYEMFKMSATTCNFVGECAIGVPPQMAVTPLNYENEVSGELTKRCYRQSIYLNNFPLCSWITDSFRAWLAQNAGRIGLTAATAVAGGLASAGMGGIATQVLGMPSSISSEQAIGGIGKTISSSLLDIGVAAQQPDHASGVSRGMLALGYNEFGYHFYNARVRDDYALIIDEYFTRFGYAAKVNKVPNRAVRTHWTYTKTLGCFITGSVPSDDGDKICKIYDNGVTFWLNPNEVGNYELSNVPLASIEEEQNG